MKIHHSRLIPIIVLFSVITVAAMGIIGWMNSTLEVNIVLMQPGMDNQPEKGISLAKDIFGNYHRMFAEKRTSRFDQVWPGFRGPDSNAISPEDTALAASWGDSGPVKLWEKSLGDGHAAAAMYKGFVYVLDYDEQFSMDLLRCFNLETGEEIWQTGYANPMKRNHGRSRSIPYVTDDLVISMGPQGHLMAVDAANGNFLWGKNMANDYLSEIPLWYSAQCPLVVNGLVLTAVCGQEVLIEAFDSRTGESVWSIPNEPGYTMSHSSIMPVSLGGIPHYVYAALGGIIGFTSRGELLWKEPWEPAVIAPSPVQTAGDLLFLTAGYGVGSMVLKVNNDGGTWNTGKMMQRLPTEGMACEQQTPLFYQGKLYGILPKDAGPNREEFCCADELGNLVWTSGPLARFGLGPWIIADGKFLILNDNGELTMADASAGHWQVLDSARVFNKGVDAWGPLAIADGFLLLRDSTILVCLDLRKETYQ